MSAQAAPALTCNHEAPILFGGSFDKNSEEAISIHPRALGRDQGGPEGKDWRDDGKAFTIDTGGGGAVLPIPISSMAAISRHGDDRIGIGIGDPGDPAPTLSKAHHHAVAMPMTVYENHAQDSRVKEVGISPQINAKAGTGGGNLPLASDGLQVRRLTPRECERLQGFPDDYTLINVKGKPASDGPRYKACGNSMAVPVMRWIGQRIQLVDSITAEKA